MPREGSTKTKIVKCESCGGSGRRQKEKCSYCKGSGKNKVTLRYTYHIDRGSAGSGSRYYNWDVIDREPHGGCFLTTSVCESLNKNDNCYELETLRTFRDTFLASNYPNEIDSYYSKAPKICSAIDSEYNRKKIYDNIFKEMISPCLKLIEKDKYEEAYQHYKNYVIFLEATYSNLDESNF